MPYLIQKISLHKSEQAAERLSELEAEGWELVPPLLQINHEAVAVLHRQENLREAMDRRIASKEDVELPEIPEVAPKARKKKPRKKAASG